jgi:peptide/nickel transport system substrate-binding protein
MHKFTIFTIIVAILPDLPAHAYLEAPVLAERVASGELPPVGERLPENPAVVEPVDQIGVYGGTWRRLALGGGDTMLTSRMGYEPLVRWDRSGKKVIPGLAERWEISDDGKTYVFHLRKGLKWSDGAPLTSADFLFVCDEVWGNKELSPVFPSWLKLGGEPVRMETPDAHTLIYRFSQPYGIFLGAIAYQGNGMLAPKHYLKQFLPEYTDKAELDRMARERGFDHWRSLYFLKSNQIENPELPTWKPYQVTVPPPATRVVAERNPYYWKVDPAGNQLPYIDRVVFTDIQNNEIATIKAMAGEVDFQARRIDTMDYSLFMTNRDKGGYRVLRDSHPSTICIYLNQHSKDTDLRPILQDRRFRIALSLAVNREELVFLLFSGMAEPARGIACPDDPYYLSEFDAKYLDYDPERACALLDEMGMKRGPDGMRRMPSGRPFRRTLNAYPSESGVSADLWQLVADYFREVGLDFTVKIDARNLSVMQVRNGNSDFWAYSTGGMHWVQDPLWYVPWLSASYYAPAYGRYIASGGKDKQGVKPSPEFQRLVDWYLELRSTVNDDARRMELGRNILRQWDEECYVIGICRPDALTIVSNRFKNVPDHIIHDWRIMTPGYIGIEQFFIDQGGE